MNAAIIFVVCSLGPEIIAQGPKYDESEDQELAIKNNLFPNGVIRYSIHFTTPSPEEFRSLRAAIEILASHTCLTFIELYPKGHYADPFALVIKMADFDVQDRTFKFTPPRYEWPYRSAVVYLNAIQDIRIVVARLLNAIAGLRYEHERRDRDEYVRVNSGNILEGFKDRFEKLNNYPPNISAFIPYSYNSIMNVGWYYKSKNGKPTIQPLNSNFQDYPFNIKSDMERVNAIYSKLIHKWCYRGVLCELKGPVHCAKNTTTRK